MSSADTIAAVSTAQGRGGVAVVRVSGDRAFGIAAALTVHPPLPGRIAVRSVIGEQCVVLAFQAPHSYTGEDVIEFQCHGGIAAPRRILDATLRSGARLAGRGEFTRRAFLNGRIDYEQARATIDLIDAKTERAAEAALSGLAQHATRHLRSCYDAALELSSLVEHSLDVDEGELPDGFASDIHARTSALLDALENAVRRLRTRSVMRHGALVVLAGKPNVGKSSLFNALVQENRAIVSPCAGTTRDAIEAWLDIDGWPVRLVDTAGLRESGDAIETEGVRRSEQYIANASLVLALSDPTGADTATLHNCAKAIRVSTKCDLRRGEGLCVSSKTGEGLDDLRQAIADSLAAMTNDGSLHIDDADANEDAIATILEAQAALQRALSADGDLVLIGNSLRDAAQIIGRSIGAEYSSDILDRLFSRFCVGK